MGLGLPIILFVGGFVILLWLFLWSRQRQQLGTIPETEPYMPESDLPSYAADDGVVVANDRGLVTHVNDTLRRWLNVEGSVPSLEALARFAQPQDSFLELFTGDGQAAFQFGNRWVQASAHTIPAGMEQRVVIVLRELNTASTSTDGGYDLSKAILIVNQIGETVNASQGIEQGLTNLLQIVQRSIPADAGEITLWDDDLQLLTPRGWVGDAMYVIALAERGGGYRLEEGISGWIARERKPVLVPDKDDPAVVRPKLPESRFRSFVGVPLTLDQRFLGTFELASETTRRYTQTDLALLMAIAKPIAIAIYNAELYSEQARRIEDLVRLQQIANDDPRGAFGAITEQIARLIGAEMCGVLIYNARRNLLVAQAPFYGVPEFIRQNYAVPVPPGSEGRAIWERDGAWYTNDLSDEPLVEPLGMNNLVTAAGMYNTLIMPLVAAGRRIGAIQLGNKRAFGGFTNRDVQNLRLLASQAAVVVEDLRLRAVDTERDTEMESLQEITLALNVINQSEDFMEQANEKVAQLMNVALCGVLLYDDAAQRLTPQLPFFGAEDWQLQGYGISLAPGSPLAQVWEEEDTFFANNVESNVLANSAGIVDAAARVGMQHTMFAVLNSAGRRIGAIQVANKRSGEPFNERDARLLLIFAAQLAGVIENSRLFREAQRRATEAERLRRVAELAGMILTPDDSFTPVLAEIARIMDSPVSFVNSYSAVTARLITETSKMYGIELVEPIIFDTFSRGFENSVAVSRRPFMSNDLSSDKRVLPVYKSVVETLNLWQTILVPLVVGDQALGELGIANREDYYTDGDLRLMSAMAIHIAAALDRVRLYENTGENLRRRLLELDAIQRVSDELALTLDLDRVLDVIRQEAARATEAGGNSVALLAPLAEWRSPAMPVISKRLGERRAFDGLSSIEKAALETPNQAVVVDDYRGTSSLLRGEKMIPVPHDARSAVAVAFTYEDEPVGIIHLYHDQPRQFDNRAAAFLTTLAAKASLSFGNNRRYVENQVRSDRLRRRVEQLNSIFELGQIIQTVVDPVTLLEAIAYSVQQSCGYDVVLMTMMDESDGTLRRVAQAGIPINEFEATRSKTMLRDDLHTLFEKREFQLSESYFFPFEQVAKWAVRGGDVLSTGFSGIRTMHPGGRNDWRDGDMLLVPIAGAEGDLLGVMSLDRPYDGARPERGTVEILEIFAHQAASTLENMRLYMQTRRDAEEEARLNEVMEAISSTLEMNAIIEAVARGALRLVPFNRMTMALLDTDGQGFDLLRATVAPDGALNTARERRSTLSHTALARTFETGREFLYSDRDEATAYDDLRSWWAEGESTSLFVPLVTGGISLGAMHFGADHESAAAFDENRDLLKRIANLSAVAVQNARLFNQALNLRAFNESVVQSIQQGIVVLDPSARILTINDFMRRTYGWDERAAVRTDLFKYRPEYKPALAAALRDVLDTGAPRELLDVRLVVDAQPRVQNFYLYPLRDGDSVRGVVLLVEDVTEREQLERALAARAEQLAALTEVSSRITAALRRDDVVSLAMEEMARVIGYDTLTFWRVEGDALTLEAWRGYTPDDPAIRVPLKQNERLCRVIDGQQAVSISQFLGTDPLPGEGQAQSWLGIPLVSKNTVIGVIALSKQQPRYYNPQSEQAALTFANQMAVALINSTLFEQQQVTTERLNLLNRASIRLAQSLDTENILEVALSEICTILDVKKARAFLFERDLGIGRVIVEYPRGDFPPTRTIDLDGMKAIRRVIQSVKPIVIERLQALSPTDDLYDDLVPTRMTGYAMLPMTVSGQVTGAFELEFYDTESAFDPEKFDLSVIIANQAAIAVQNAHLLEQTLVRTRELETLLEAAQATSLTLDLNEVFARVVELTMHALDMDDCTLMIYDNVEDILRVELNVNRTPDERNTLPVGTTFDLFAFPAKMRAIRDRQVVVIRQDDANADARELADMQSQGDIARMLVPLATSTAGEAIGLLQVDLHDHMRTFTHRETRMAQALGAQAATRIENARLTTETAAQVEQAIVINELSRAISSTMDINGMIRTVREQVASLMSARDIYMALYDADSQQITFPMAVHDGNDQHIASRPLGDDEVSFVIKSRRPLSLGGEMGVDEVRRNLKISNSEGAISRYLGVPIIAGDQVQGVLAVRDTEVTRPFGLNDQRVLTTIGAQIGAAIQNARLFDRIRRFADELNLRVQERTAELQTERDRLDSLYRITAELGSTLEYETVLNRALTMSADAIGADDGVVLILDPMTDRLLTRATLHTISDAPPADGSTNGAASYRPGDSTEARRTRELRIAPKGAQQAVSHPAEMFAQWLIQRQDAMLIDDLHRFDFWDTTAAGAAEWHSAIGVVLRTNDAVQGAIVFLGHAVNLFNEPQLKLVSAASSQVSAAINNADLYNLLRDQTQRMANLLRLEREEAEKNSAILEGIADGVLLANADGVIMLFNGAAARILDVPRDYALNQPLARLQTLYEGAEVSWVSLLDHWITRSQRPQRDNLLLERIEVGRKVVSITASPVFNADVFLGTVAVFRDITRDVEVDRMKSDFISNVSHELRTPMTSIKGYADLLMMGAAGNVTDQQRGFLETIKGNAERLSNLVNDLLNISRLDSGSEKIALERFSMADVIAWAVEGVQARSDTERKHISVTAHIDPALPPVLADRQKVAQILENLVDNAFNYTYPGGKIEITAQRDQESPFMLVSVKDNGIGIPKDFLPRIWDRFERFEEHALVMEVAGTGLGLSIVKNLVEMHRGRVWAESEPNIGSTFAFALPIDGPESVSDPDNRSAANALPNPNQG
ncbi:MAG: GAF domain-containing protein [bacterium]|nr:GAF domain-containing protein [bacterium]